MSLSKNNRKTSLLVLILVLLPCTAFQGAQDDLPRVLIIGDSIAGGYFPYVKELLKGKALVSLPMDENGETISCEGTSKGVCEVEKWVDQTDWDVIHFNFGLHDMKHIDPGTGKNSKNLDHPQQADPEQYEKNLAAIVEILKTTGAVIIFATTTPYPDTLANQMRSPGMPVIYNRLALQVMSEYDIDVNDLYGFVLTGIKEWQRPQNVHFNEAGSKALAGQVALAIGNHLDNEVHHEEVIERLSAKLKILE